MRDVLAVLTALPVRRNGTDVGAEWVATAVVGIVLGLIWFVFHQLVVLLAGPLVAAVAVVAVGAASTGSRPFRGLAGVADALADGDEPAAPPAGGVATTSVVLLVLVQVALLQRVNLAPAVIVVVPMVARVVQVVLLRRGDDAVGVPAPSMGARLWLLLLCGVLLTTPMAVARLERPVRLDGPLAGLGYVVVGLGALGAALAVGWLARAWLLARFGRLDASGWHLLCALAETAALFVIAVRIG